MTQIKVNKMSREEIKAKLENAGIKVRESRQTMAASTLPETGTFTDFRTEDNPSGSAPIIRMIAVDEQGKQHECALGRLAVFGIKKVSKDQTLSESDIVLRPTTSGLKYQLNGRNLNNLPTAQHETIAALLGKKFKAVEKEAFAIAFLPEGMPNYESKKQALETEFIRPYFELELTGDAE